MKASVEMPNGKYKSMEMGDPVCGEDFCDECGDCLSCYGEGWGDHTCFWVIYIDDPKNPFNKKKKKRVKA